MPENAVALKSVSGYFQRLFLSLMTEKISNVCEAVNDELSDHLVARNREN
ncbi:hypothetical protein MH1LPH_20540 [Lactiplantibacillus brownii]